MSLYTKLIQEAAPGCDPVRVEEMMRVQSPTLDNLRRPEFMKLARLAAAAVREMVKPEVNRNISDALVKEQNDAQTEAQAKKTLKRSKERANRMRGERKGRR
jgi:ribosome recycling factor